MYANHILTLLIEFFKIAYLAVKHRDVHILFVIPPHSAHKTRVYIRSWCPLRWSFPDDITAFILIKYVGHHLIQASWQKGCTKAETHFV